MGNMRQFLHFLVQNAFLRSYVVSLGILGIIAAGAFSQGPGVPFQAGDRFPSILLPSLADGSGQSIADFQGRKLVLHIWASW